MLIRVVTTGARIPRTGERIAFVHGEIEPKVSAMDGNRGFVLAVDHSAGRYVGIAAWSDPEALEVSGRDAPDLIAELVGRLHGSEPAVDVFDLVLAHVVKPPRVGYWARLTRLEMPMQDVPRAVHRFKELVQALFARYDERYDGTAAIVVFVDRASGVLENLMWYDSLRVLRGTADRARELRELLVADVPTVRVVEVSELEVVIAETQESSWNELM
jgi:hypothetical protein